MKRFSGKHEGDLNLSGDLELAGVVTGTVTVPPGAYLRMSGLIAGNLVVERKARAKISGVVDGSVINNGGTVHVSGIVGRVLDQFEGVTTVDPRAFVRNSD